jgi:hypothetical protein
MLQLRNARKRRNPPVLTVVPRPISVPKSTNVSIGPGVYMRKPWSTNYQNTATTFAGKDLEMYAFNISGNDNPDCKFDTVSSSTPLVCHVYSSNDLTTPRTTTNNTNTLSGTSGTHISFKSFLSAGADYIEVPVSFWGPHDTDAKLSIEVHLFDIFGIQKSLVSEKFAAMVAVT